MTFKDFVKSTGLASTEVSLVNMAAALLLALALGVFIFWVYKRTFQGVL